MKLTKKYIQTFKDSFIFWQKQFGLTQYDVAFFQDKLTDCYAKINVNEEAKVVSVMLPFELAKLDSDSDEGPESNALHEAIHLLIHRLTWLGSLRYIQSCDLDEENEAIVNRLVKVLKESHNE